LGWIWCRVELGRGRNGVGPEMVGVCRRISTVLRRRRRKTKRKDKGAYVGLLLL
jgi:hypothetical protein